MPTPTKAALEAWLQARGTDEGPLFVNFDRAGKGGRLTGSAVYFTSVSSGRRLGSTHQAAMSCRSPALKNGNSSSIVTFAVISIS